MILTQQCIKFRVPEPIRVADLGSREHIRKWLKAQKQPTSEANKQQNKPKSVNPKKQNKQQNNKQQTTTTTTTAASNGTAAATATSTSAAVDTKTAPAPANGNGAGSPPIPAPTQALAPVAASPRANAWLNRTATAALTAKPAATASAAKK